MKETSGTLGQSCVVLWFPKSVELNFIMEKCEYKNYRAELSMALKVREASQKRRNIGMLHKPRNQETYPISIH